MSSGFELLLDCSRLVSVCIECSAGGGLSLDPNTYESLCLESQQAMKGRTLIPKRLLLPCLL